MKDAYYFSHDSNARNDPKNVVMRSIYGAQGYGWYWIIVEILREQDEYKLELKKHTYSALALELQCDSDTAERFVSDCINEFELFETDGKYLWSDSLLRRMAEKDARIEQARKAAQARWHKDIKPKEQCKDSRTNAVAMREHSSSNAIKVKESKVKQIDREIASPPVVWEHMFGSCSSLIMTSLDEFEAEKGVARDLLLLGMAKTKEAIRDGPNPIGNTFKYFCSIINNWISKDIKTIGKLREYEAKGGQADGSERHVGGRVSKAPPRVSKTAGIDWDKFDSA